MRILAIDPGKVKFGYAVLTANKKVLRQGTAEVADLARVAKDLVDSFHVVTVVIGDRTGGVEFDLTLRRALNTENVQFAMIGEDGSSVGGRRRFLQANRRGWRRLIPLGLQAPWRPFDDYVAVILGERYLDQR